MHPFPAHILFFCSCLQTTQKLSLHDVSISTLPNLSILTLFCILSGFYPHQSTETNITKVASDLHLAKTQWIILSSILFHLSGAFYLIHPSFLKHVFTAYRILHYLVSSHHWPFIHSFVFLSSAHPQSLLSLVLISFSYACPEICGFKYHLQANESQFIPLVPTSPWKRNGKRQNGHLRRPYK